MNLFINITDKNFLIHFQYLSDIKKNEEYSCSTLNSVPKIIIIITTYIWTNKILQNMRTVATYILKVYIYIFF